MRHALAAALIAALPVAAQAQDRPQIYPTRDVALPAGHGREVRLHRRVAGARHFLPRFRKTGQTLILISSVQTPS